MSMPRGIGHKGSKGEGSRGIIEVPGIIVGTFVWFNGAIFTGDVVFRRGIVSSIVTMELLSQGRGTSVSAYRRI